MMVLCKSENIEVTIHLRRVCAIIFGGAMFWVFAHVMGFISIVPIFALAYLIFEFEYNG